jgi:Ser/Thr protein kinase RdoA (MazF antagonist)
MQGTLVEADWPPLTLAEADRVLRRYPQAQGAARLLSVSPRPFSAGSVVECPGDAPLGKVFVKRHHRMIRDREGLLEEHRLLEHLYPRCDLVRPALADADGETVVELEEWVYEAHPVAAGVDVYEQALSWTPFHHSGHAYAAGRALARLHQAAEGYAAPARKSQQLVSSFTIFADEEPARAMERYLDTRPLLKAYAEQRTWRRTFDELLLPLQARLLPWLAELQPLWTHNDFHASNCTWSGPAADAEVMAIIDFGLADRTNAVHDLATAIERNAIEWLRMEEPGAELIRLDRLDALLLGYSELHPLTYGERRAIAAMLPLVHCEFALSETDYFLSVLHSPERAYLAYEGYFVEHARWFLGPQGKRLLDHLERWAQGEVVSDGGRP